MGKLKLKILVISLITVAVTFVMQESLAYYTTVGTATNVVTSGEIAFKIHETTNQGTPFPTEGVDIMPGQIVSKRVSVENVCTHPFYLRVKIVYGINSDVLPAKECFELNIDQTNWVLNEDGWYYYQGIVEPQTTTPYVFSDVTMVGSQIDNRHLGKTLSLSIVAQATQSENNPITDNKYHTAFGWPQE